MSHHPYRIPDARREPEVPPLVCLNCLHAEHGWECTEPGCACAKGEGAGVVGFIVVFGLYQGPILLHEDFGLSRWASWGVSILVVAVLFALVRVLSAWSARIQLARAAAARTRREYHARHAAELTALRACVDSDAHSLPTPPEFYDATPSRPPIAAASAPRS